MAFEVLGEKPTPEILKLQEDSIRFEWGNRDELLKAARLLKAKYPERFKFRPHPAEWKGAYDEFKDCMDESGSFSERLKQTAVVIFASGCGTGLEAFNAGVPAVRIGNGGLGLSRDIGDHVRTAAECVDAVAARSKDRVSVGNLDGHFAPDTLAQAIESLWRKNSFPEMDFDLKIAWEARKAAFEPGAWHSQKMGNVTTDLVSQLAGLPAQQLGWNVFSVSPHA